MLNSNETQITYQSYEANSSYIVPCLKQFDFKLNETINKEYFYEHRNRYHEYVNFIWTERNFYGVGKIFSVNSFYNISDEIAFALDIAKGTIKFK